MQIMSPDYDASTKGEVASIEEVTLCRGFRKLPPSGSAIVTATTTTISTSSSLSPLLHVVTASLTTTTTTTCTTTRTSSYSREFDNGKGNNQVVTTPAVHLHCEQTDTITTTGTPFKSTYTCKCNKETKEKDSCTCSIPNPRKRKMEDESEESEVISKDKSFDLEKCRTLLLLKRRVLSNLAQRNNVPLFYLYGDLLLIPKYRWGSGMGFGGTNRSRMDPDLSTITPIDDANSSLESASRHHHRSNTQSLVQLQIDESNLLEDEDSAQGAPVNDLIDCLNQLGVCVMDNFLEDGIPEQVLAEVEALHGRGEFQAGQVMSRNVQDQASRMVRGDEITWVTGNEPHCRSIGHLMAKVDKLVVQANRHRDAGELSRYNIRWRTRAMVACYPGRGTHYVKHVDNPDGDGRCITAIYYLNKDWRPEDGGVLRIMPEGTDQVASINPIFNRMLFFWSDRRNPHEVLPANFTRFAITLWYHDQREREEYLSRMSS